MEGTLVRSFVKKIKGKETPQQEMSFMDHLEALRGHLFRCVIAIVAASVVIFIFIDYVFDNIIYAPARADFITYDSLCNLSHNLRLGDALCMPPVNIPLLGSTVSGPFMSAITIAFTGGMIVAFPFVFREMWKYIKPALSQKELENARGSMLWISICFFCGAAFGYFLLAPFTFNFLGNYTLGNIGAYVYMPTLNDYIDTLTSIILGCGIGFQLPVVAYFFSKAGIVTPKLLKSYRKYAYIIILILAGVITPSPDWTSQLIVTIPLVLLYEISIMLSAKVVKQKLQTENLN